MRLKNSSLPTLDRVCFKLQRPWSFYDHVLADCLYSRFCSSVSNMHVKLLVYLLTPSNQVRPSQRRYESVDFSI